MKQNLPMPHKLSEASCRTRFYNYPCIWVFFFLSLGKCVSPNIFQPSSLQILNFLQIKNYYLFCKQPFDPFINPYLLLSTTISSWTTLIILYKSSPPSSSSSIFLIPSSISINLPTSICLYRTFRNAQLATVSVKERKGRILKILYKGGKDQMDKSNISERL